MTTLEELEKNHTKVNREEEKAAPLLSLLFFELDYANLFEWVFFYSKSLYVFYNIRKDLIKDSENYYTVSFPTQTSVEVCQNNNSLWLKINPFSLLTATGRLCFLVVKKQFLILSWYFIVVYSEYQWVEINERRKRANYLNTDDPV